MSILLALIIMTILITVLIHILVTKVTRLFVTISVLDFNSNFIFYTSVTRWCTFVNIG